MTHVGGSFNFRTIQDTRGATDQSVAGNNNNVRYVGDNGANTFHVGGFRNNVTVENVGRDERIMLEGRPQDWQIAPDSNPRDGRVTYHNTVTGNSVTVATDAGRNDAFARSKVSFTGNYQSLANPVQNACAGSGGWNNLGNAAMFAFGGASYLAGYLAGYGAGRGAGFLDGFSNGAGWGAFTMLPFRAWGLGCF